MLKLILHWYREYRNTLEFNRGFKSAHDLLLDCPEERRPTMICILTAVIAECPGNYSDGAMTAINQFKAFSKETDHEKS